MYWLFSQFNEYYAPLEHKENRFGFKYDALKAKYLEAAKQTQNNEEFYKLMHQFVAEFKDAHTSASIENAALPARTKIAYLGFSGKRVGDKFFVTDLLPSIKALSAFPIRKGDFVTKLDGMPLKNAIAKDMTPYHDLGQEQSNLTFHMNRLFNRVNTSGVMPKNDTAVLSVVRGGQEVQVALPWVVKDLYQFSREQKDTAPPKKAAPAEQNVSSQSLGSMFQIGYLSWNGKITNTNEVMQKLLREAPGFDFWQTFKFIDTTPVWAELSSEVRDNLAGFELLAKERSVPPTAVPLAEAKIFPAYVSRERVPSPTGTAGALSSESGPTRLVGYIYLNTFSPAGGEDAVVREVGQTLDKMQTLGVQDLVIDMIDNGGGSLLLGMKLAQLLSNEKVVQPGIQFRLSETWLDDFEKTSLLGDSDAERELSRRVFEGLLEDKANGQRLSRRFSIEALQPFTTGPNTQLRGKLNIVLMVNEMCASMCDIFTAILKDNKMARVVGSKTMGAGGNVVDHPYAPNRHLSVRQTESLILRADGSYIENNGIEPDVAMNVSESAHLKYDDVRKKAVEVLLAK